LTIKFSTLAAKHTDGEFYTGDLVKYYQTKYFQNSNKKKAILFLPFINAGLSFKTRKKPALFL